MYTDVTVWSVFLSSALPVISLQRCADRSSNRQGKVAEGGNSSNIRVTMEVFEGIENLLPTCICLLTRNWFCVLSD